MSKDTLQPTAALRAEIARDFDTLARSRRLRMGLFCALGLGLALLAGLAGEKRAADFGSAGHTVMLLIYALGAITLTGFAFGLTLPAARWLRGVLVGGVVLAFGTLLISLEPSAGAPVAMGAGCLAMGLSVSLGAVAIALGLGRSVIRRHAPSGLLLGLGAGFLGLLTLHLVCDSCARNPVGLMGWHGMVPVLAGALSGAAWAWLRPR